MLPLVGGVSVPGVPVYAERVLKGCWERLNYKTNTLPTLSRKRVVHNRIAEFTVIVSPSLSATSSLANPILQTDTSIEKPVTFQVVEKHT